MDDIKQRLEDVVKECTERYVAWRGNAADSTLRGKLMESAHELRKVAARLEIELAVADRGDAKSRQIPIPSHRAATGEHRRDDNSQRQQPRKVEIVAAGADVKADAPAEAADVVAEDKPKVVRTGRSLSLKRKTADDADTGSAAE